MSILIVGSEGSQGQRYQAILDYMGEQFLCRDTNFSEISNERIKMGLVDGIIIATPTPTHVKLIREFLPFGIPIFCEKPICKNVAELETLFDEIERSKTPFSMSFQYKKLVPPDGVGGASYYNYFKHGNDGLIWDCIQIVGLSRGEVELSESSPIWKCRINGENINITDMDLAYIDDLTAWLNGDYHSLEYLLKVHKKTAAIAELKELTQ